MRKTERSDSPPPPSHIGEKIITSRENTNVELCSVIRACVCMCVCVRAHTRRGTGHAAKSHLVSRFERHLAVLHHLVVGAPDGGFPDVSHGHLRVVFHDDEGRAILPRRVRARQHRDEQQRGPEGCASPHTSFSFLPPHVSPEGVIVSLCTLPPFCFQSGDESDATPLASELLGARLDL